MQDDVRHGRIPCFVMLPLLSDDNTAFSGADSGQPHAPIHSAHAVARRANATLPPTPIQKYANRIFPSPDAPWHSPSTSVAVALQICSSTTAIRIRWHDNWHQNE